MAKVLAERRSMAEKIFDNIIFLGDIFGNCDDWEIPDVPVLELAMSFELKHSDEALAGSPGHK